MDCIETGNTNIRISLRGAGARWIHNREVCIRSMRGQDVWCNVFTALESQCPGLVLKEITMLLFAPAYVSPDPKPGAALVF